MSYSSVCKKKLKEIVTCEKMEENRGEFDWDRLLSTDTLVHIFGLIIRHAVDRDIEWETEYGWDWYSGVGRPPNLVRLPYKKEGDDLHTTAFESMAK